MSAIHLCAYFLIMPLAIPLRAKADRWEDPDWETMLRDSDPIILVEVDRGGSLWARVKSLTAFKGTPPAPTFWVGGFNSRFWPPHAIEKESFKTGEKYYLFLKKGRFTPAAIEELQRDAKDIPDMAEFVASVEREGFAYVVWTPTAGDIPLRDGKVHYDLLQTGYSQYAPPKSREDFEKFLRATLAFSGTQKADPAYLDQVAKALSGEIEKEGKESLLGDLLMRLCLCGETSYREVFQKIAEGKQIQGRFALAKLLGQVEGPKANELLISLVGDADSLVQGEAVRQLAWGDPKVVGPVLLKHLKTASEGGLGPVRLMDPVRNRVDGGKFEIVRALGKMKYEPSAPALLEILEGTENEDLLMLIVQALEEMRNRGYTAVMAKRLEKRADDLAPMAEWAKERRVVELKGPLERFVSRFDRTRDKPFYGLGRAVDALGMIGDPETGSILTRLLESQLRVETPENGDKDFLGELFSALGELKYGKAREVIHRAIFYWYGVDPAFGREGKLWETKTRLEREILEKALAYITQSDRKEGRCLVFLENRDALAQGSVALPKHSCRVRVNIHIKPDQLDLPALQARIAQTLQVPSRHVVVCAVQGNYSRIHGNDDRLWDVNDSRLISGYCRYIKHSNRPEDDTFLEFLLKSGLAKAWNAERDVRETLVGMHPQGRDFIPPLREGNPR